MFIGMALVEEGQFVQGLALVLAGLVGGRLQVENGGTGRPQARALVMSGQETVAPVAGTAFFTEVPLGLEEAAQKMAQTAKSSVMVQGGHKGLLVTGRKLQRGRVLDGFAGG